jgi:hypothetical protein
MDRIHVDRDLHDSHDLEDATNVVRRTAIVCDLVRLCLEHESDRIDALSAHVRSSECLGHHRLEETIMKYTDTQLKRENEELVRKLNIFRERNGRLCDKLAAAVCERDSYREKAEELSLALDGACQERFELGTDYTPSELRNQYIDVARSAINAAKKGEVKG